MSKELSESQLRMKLALFISKEPIEVEDIYRALGADINQCHPDALSHLAGILDGLNLAKDLYNKDK